MQTALNTVWEGDTPDIDAFIDYGLTIDDPQAVQANQILQPHQRAVVMRNVDPAATYSFWVEAFRKVDTSITPSGIILSAEAPANSNNYIPNNHTAFGGTIEDALDGPDPAASVRIYADLTAANQSSMTTPNGLTILEDYTGTPDPSGQYPATFSWARARGSVDVTTNDLTSWVIISYSGGLNSGNTVIDNTLGSTTKGVMTVTDDGTHPTGSVIVQSTYNGIAPLQGTVVIGFTKSAPPTNNTGTLGGTNVTATNTDTVISIVLNTVSNGTSIACSAASENFWVGVTDSYGTCHADMKWQWSANGTTGWTDVGSYVTETSAGTASSAGKFGYIPGTKGVITCNQTLSGTTNGVLYYFRLVAKSISTPSVAYPMMFSGSISVS